MAIFDKNFKKNFGYIIIIICTLIMYNFLHNKVNYFKNLYLGKEQQNETIVKKFSDSLTTIITVNTNQKKELEKAYKNLLLSKDLKIDSLNRYLKLVSIQHGTGTVTLHDTVKIEDGTIHDHFFTFSFNLKNNVMIYDFNSFIRLEGVEWSDKFGNHTKITKVYLESFDSSGYTYPVDWKETYTVLKPTTKLFHLWNPKLHSDIIAASKPQFGLSFNLMTYGPDLYIEKTDLYFLSFGLASDFNNKITATFYPVKYNIGRDIPFLTNLNIGAGIGWEFIHNKPEALLSIGVVH